MLYNDMLPEAMDLLAKFNDRTTVLAHKSLSVWFL